MRNDHVILVDESDQELGVMPKLEAHEKGLLHRAFSIFILNEKGEIMLQQRASEKYHSPNLWTNTCCSHPQKGESILQAGTRRLVEEMGFTTTLTHESSFIYRAEFDNGLIENELDYLLIGKYELEVNPNPEEVKSWKWMSVEEIASSIKKQPDLYTVWFKIIFEKFFVPKLKSS